MNGKALAQRLKNLDHETTTLKLFFVASTFHTAPMQLLPSHFFICSTTENVRKSGMSRAEEGNE